MWVLSYLFSSELSQPHFEGNVKSPFTLPKMGLGSPPRLPKTQNLIARVKTPRKVYISKMASHEPFGHLQHKLWLKERSGVKLVVWLPTTKSQESTWSWCVHVTCDTSLERSQGELQVCFRSRPNRRPGWEVMNAQSPRSPNRDNFGTPLWESLKIVPFRCKCGGEAQRILYGGRWWLPPSLGRGESNESVLLVACPNTENVSECELTNLLVGFDARPSN
jgi:hypothetical protein